MHIIPTAQVKDMALEDPRLRETLESQGIDTCCGGNKSLQDAAREAKLPLDQLTRTLREALQGPLAATAARDWRAASADELCTHIVNTHHAYLYAKLPALEKLLAKVRQAHAERRGAMLEQLTLHLTSLSDDLLQHLAKEERILFPFIQALEVQGKGGPAAQSPCGDVSHPINQMMHEHELAGQLLGQLRKDTDNYTVHDDFCPSFKALYQDLQALEADLHEHIFLENNILFPKAQEIGQACPACTSTL